MANSSAVIPDNIIVVDGEIGSVPAPESGDAGKILVVNSDLEPEWSTPSGGTQYSAGTGIDISAQNAISIDTTVVATQTDLSGIDQVPTVTSNDDGKVLKATYSGGVGSFDWATVSGGNDNVFIADSTTTQGDLFDAYTAKKSLFAYYSNRIYPITNNGAGGSSMLILNGCYVKTSGQSVEATKAEIRIALTNGSPTSPTTAVQIATYSAINVSNQTLASLTTAGVTDIQQVNALPAQPVATVLYLIPET